MNKEFEKWIVSLTGEASSYDVSEAHFWVNAFVKEIEKQAKDQRNREENGMINILPLSYRELAVSLNTIIKKFDLNKE